MALVSATLKILHAKMAEFNVKKVVQVTMTIGTMTNVEEMTFKAAFEVCTEGTALEGVRLVIERVPIRGKCAQCELEFTVMNYRFQCPQCAQRNVEIIAGKEFYIKSIEAE
ncbi:hydrogenase maturation nickel metallochaperone HypA [Sporomusa carbonis]|uniref:hydrogenase maturation nickel metallochaperone HypA/HybF n=1 Tax=Sporomusa carbonis TaxID=3076075 RepID=UPI003C79D78D